jgi:hypothetical protein
MVGIYQLPESGINFHYYYPEKIIIISGLQNVSSIRLYDILGRIVYSNTSNESEIRINVSGLQTGVYVAEVNGVRKKVVVE